MKKINEKIKDIQDNASLKIEKINIEAQKHIDLLYKLNDIFPILKDTLKEVGFSINDFSSQRTGAYCDGDQLKVSLKLLPISPKFKFIKPTGYNKRGGAKNRNLLINKASKYNDLIKTKTGINISFNPYSFELDLNSKILLAEFLIK